MPTKVQIGLGAALLLAALGAGGYAIFGGDDEDEGDASATSGATTGGLATDPTSDPGKTPPPKGTADPATSSEPDAPPAPSASGTANAGPPTGKGYYVYSDAHDDRIGGGGRTQAECEASRVGNADASECKQVAKAWTVVCGVDRYLHIYAAPSKTACETSKGNFCSAPAQVAAECAERD